MDCSECGAAALPLTIPEAYRSTMPGDEPAVTLCPRCLTVDPLTEPPDEEPSLQQVSEAFPTNREAAVPMALLVGLLANLALYRSEISELLAAVERNGADPLLVLDRLAADDSIEPELDLSGRRRQLEQLL